MNHNSYIFCKWVWLSIEKARIRSVLVILAMSLAATCVSLSLGVIAGLNKEFASFVEETGIFDVLTVSTNMSSQNLRYSGLLTESDGDAIERAQQGSYVGSEIVWWQCPLQSEVSSTRQILAGITTGTLMALRHDIIEGRGITDFDNVKHNRVMVIGQKAVAALFPKETNVIGRHIRVRDFDFVIVGVLRRYAYYDGNNVDEMPYKNGYNFIPLKTAQELFSNNDSHVSYVQVRVPRPEQIHETEDLIRNILYLRHRFSDSFLVNTSEAQAQQWTKTQSAMKVGLAILSITCLIIGATCTVNAQLSSVSERVREFGVRRSIGASQCSILQLVLMETAVVCVIGSLAGSVFSVVVIPIVRALMPTGFPGAPIFVWWSVPLSLLTTTMVGLLAGIWPARKAARLDPHQAMRVV